MSIAAAMIAGLRVLVTRNGGGAGRAARVACCAVTIAWVAGLGLGMYPASEALSPRRFAERVRAVVGEDDLVTACGHVSSAFRYYMERPLPQWSRELDGGRRRSFVVAQAQDEERRKRFRFATRLIQHAYPGVRSLLELDEGRTLAAARSRSPGHGGQPVEPRRPRRCHDSCDAAGWPPRSGAETSDVVAAGVARHPMRAPRTDYARAGVTSLF